MARSISRRKFVLSTAAVLATPSRTLWAADEPGALLTDDFSRSEIFQMFVVDPWEAENAGPNKTLAIPDNFQFPRDVVNDCTVNADGHCLADASKPRSKDMMFGIDISHYTDAGSFSFGQLRAQQVRFVQMKTSQGDSNRDGNFQQFWKSAGQLLGEHKVFRGPYHFLTAGADGKKQADWFLSLMDRAGGLKADDMPPGVDLEWDVYRNTGKTDHWNDKGDQYIIDTALGCLDRIKEKTGRTPILYTGRSWFGPHTVPLDRFKEFSIYPLWVFDYNPKRKIQEKPSLPDNSQAAALWQFSGSASVPVCYPKGVDASVFYGDETAFKKAFGIA
jgi:lysozyme